MKNITYRQFLNKTRWQQRKVFDAYRSNMTYRDKDNHRFFLKKIHSFFVEIDYLCDDPSKLYKNPYKVLTFRSPKHLEPYIHKGMPTSTIWREKIEKEIQEYSSQVKELEELNRQLKKDKAS